MTVSLSFFNIVITKSTEKKSIEVTQEVVDQLKQGHHVWASCTNEDLLKDKELCVELYLDDILVYVFNCERKPLRREILGLLNEKKTVNLASYVKDKNSNLVEPDFTMEIIAEIH